MLPIDYEVTQSNLESPWTLSSLLLELPVLYITQTVDLIKPLTISQVTTLMFN